MKLSSKRRRSKVEIAEEREQSRLRQEGLDRETQERIQQLEARLAQMEEEKRNGDEASSILHRWAEEGKVVQDGDGTVRLVEDPVSQID